MKGHKALRGSINICKNINNEDPGGFVKGVMYNI